MLTTPYGTKIHLNHTTFDKRHIDNHLLSSLPISNRCNHTDTECSHITIFPLITQILYS